ncbi:hypothetical protein DFH08DRAFT_997319 [Mycena albidolilacea]|uniref:Nucleoporin Nup54 alpha-helical domain-containing protein n=1 Tax=Mycena albidolilacea TaxID=1033008 RepID=A0AAD7ESQ4_9AGAR|nr:hypothetical protein DFH08DRAFT_997319 [Mycena albidolilacea]
MLLFGQPQPQPQQQTSNIFGGATTQPQRQQQSGGGLFGAAQPSTTQPATTSIFGQPNMSQQVPSLFGGATNTNMNNTPNTGSGTNTNTKDAGTGFRNSQQQQQAQQWPAQQSQPAAGGSLFGNPQQQQGQQPALGGLFGNNAANTNVCGGGLFGAVKPVGGLAGAPMLLSLNTVGSLLFSGGSTNGNALGQPPTQHIFWQPVPVPGVQQNQQQWPGLFGGALSSSNILGASSTNANGTPKSAPAFRSSFGLRLGTQQKQQHTLRLPGAVQPGQGQGQCQAANAQTQFAQLMARIEGIAVAWNAAGLECQFQYIFCNRAGPAWVGLYGCPPDATNNMLWVPAVRENLDPGCLVPAIVVGFDDLQQRVNAQGTQAGAYQERMKGNGCIRVDDMGDR